MMKVENRKTLWMLAWRFMKMNRMRNRIAVPAIALTSLLFTSLFVGTKSMVLSKLEADKKTYSSWCHAVLQDVLPKEGERVAAVLRQSSEVAYFGTDLFVGLVQDPRVPFQTEVRVVDSDAAKAFDCVPEEGKLPEGADEIALSSVVLDALGIPCTIGAEIPLRIGLDVGGKEEAEIWGTFSLCGWWEQDISARSQYAWVSEAFADRNVPPLVKEAMEEGAQSGAVSFSVWFRHVNRLEQKTEALGERCGFWDTGVRGKGFQINPAYAMLTGEGSISAGRVILPVLLIMLAGYLIIYNIFSISVKTDIRAYGLLKNVGTTGKQLARIVRLQAFCLCLAGIPAGMLAGYGCSILIGPSLTANLHDVETQTETVLRADPMIFAVAALFAMLTVYLSCLQACRIVSRVSPAEALRIAEGAEGSRHAPFFAMPRSGKRKVRDNSASWQAMALENVIRNRKKGVLVMLSLALCLMTCNGIWMIVKGYDMERYQEAYMASDFELDKLPALAEYAQMDGIAQQQQETLNACPHAEAVGYVRYSYEEHEMEPHLLQTWEQIMRENDGISTWWEEVWNRSKAENKMEIILMGIDRTVFEKLQWRDEGAAWEDFAGGKYILVDYPRLSRQGASSYRPGDSFRMEYQSGAEREYRVLAEARLPYSLDYPYTNLISVTVMLPAEEFIDVTGSTAAMRVCLDAAAGKEKELQDYLQQTVLAQDKRLILHSVLDLRASFARYLNRYYMVGSALAVVLALIGIMNFYNMTAASVLGRKRELALLEAVGMTKRQIEKMLISEGILYLAGALLLAVCLTCLCGKGLLAALLGQAFFFRIRVTVLPCLLLVPALLAVAIRIPVHRFAQMSRKSVVQRIRESI